MPESAPVVTCTVCCFGPFQTSETRMVAVAAPPPMMVHIVPSIIVVGGGDFSKSTTSPENTASEYDSACLVRSCLLPTIAQEQAEAQSGSRTTTPRTVRNTEARATSARLTGTSSFCIRWSDAPTTTAV